MIVRRRMPWGKVESFGIGEGESVKSPVKCGTYWRSPETGEEFVCQKKEFHCCLPVWMELLWHARWMMKLVRKNREGGWDVVRNTIELETQLRCIGRALCMKIYSDEFKRFVRRFRRLDDREPRRNGKTWKIEFLVSWFLLRENNIQIALAAQSMEASGLGVWRAVQTMCRQSIGTLDAQIVVKAKLEPIYNPLNGSEVVLLPSEPDRLRGLDNPKVIFLDEVRAVREAREWAANAQAAQLSIEEPFFMTCTTANSDPESYEFERFHRLLDIRDQPDIEPSTLPELWHHPTGADWQDTKNWYKSNPGLGKIKKKSLMMDLYKKALGLPDEERIFRLEHLNEIVDELGGAVDEKLWRECGSGKPEDAFDKICECDEVLAGADLSWGGDFTSLALLGRNSEDGKLWAWHHSWCHYSKLANQSAEFLARVQNWSDAGVLSVVPADVAPPSDLFVEFVAQKMNAIIESLPEGVKVLGFDVARASPAVKVWEQERIEYRQVRQGQFLDDAIATFQDIVRSLQLAHGNDPLLTSAVLNAVITRLGAFDRRSIQKNASRVKYGVRVDPLVALVCAVECLLRPEDPRYSPGSGAKSIAEIQASVNGD